MSRPTLTTAVAVLAGVLYLQMLWLPDADPEILSWPQSLVLLGVPMLLAGGM